MGSDQMGKMPLHRQTLPVSLTSYGITEETWELKGIPGSTLRIVFLVYEGQRIFLKGKVWNSKAGGDFGGKKP